MKGLNGIRNLKLRFLSNGLRNQLGGQQGAGHLRVFKTSKWISNTYENHMLNCGVKQKLDMIVTVRML